MEPGELGIVVAAVTNASVGDLCIALDVPRLERVGGWGAQIMIKVLCNGKSTSIPDYCVTRLDPQKP